MTNGISYGNDTEVVVISNCEQLAKDYNIKYGLVSFKIENYKVVNIRKESNKQIRK